jgi:hypothetical protein
MARFVYGLACIQLILAGSTLQDESTPGLAAFVGQKGWRNLRFLYFYLHGILYQDSRYSLRWCVRIGTISSKTRADELMITSQIYDHAARRWSFEIAAEALSR